MDEPGRYDERPVTRALHAAALASQLLAAGGVPRSTRNGTESPLRVFHDGGKAYVFDTSKNQCRQLLLPADAYVSETALTPDARHLVFTAVPTGTKNAVPYAAELSSPGDVHRLTDTPGHYGNPGVSDDGSTAYFSFVPDKAGVPLNHAPMRFAEIAALPFAGGEPRLLTNNPGCHFAPRGAPDGFLAIHAACSTPARWIEITRGDRLALSLPVTVEANEAVLCNHGHDVTYTGMASGQMVLTTAELKTRRTHDIPIGTFQPVLQLQCGPGNAVMILRDHQIEIIKPSGQESVFKIEGCKP